MSSKGRYTTETPVALLGGPDRAGATTPVSTALSGAMGQD